jgi:hypothetical protein
MMLNMLQQKKVGLQAQSIAGDQAEAASSLTKTVATQGA